MGNRYLVSYYSHQLIIKSGAIIYTNDIEK
jgi:hypothetical protein